jgi:hypothetical protein
MGLRSTTATWIASRSVLGVLFFISLHGCGVSMKSRGVPVEVTTAIDAFTSDLDAERYDKIYQDADELFRREATLDDATALLRTMRTKLGKVKNRSLHSATEQQNSGGDLKGNAFILTYETNFENGKGMEGFTFIERSDQWLLARYRVNSTELK